MQQKKMEKQILTVEQARCLQDEFGMDMTDAAIWFVRLSPAGEWESIFATDGCTELFNKPQYHDCYCPTYTLQEILDHIPKVQYSFGGEVQTICYGNVDLDVDYCTEHGLDYFNLLEHGTTNLQGAYNLLVWVLKNLKSGFFVKE